MTFQTGKVAGGKGVYKQKRIVRSQQEVTSHHHQNSLVTHVKGKLHLAFLVEKISKSRLTVVHKFTNLALLSVKFSRHILIFVLITRHV